MGFVLDEGGEKGFFSGDCVGGGGVGGRKVGLRGGVRLE